MNQGEIWDLANMGLGKVLVVSSDAHNGNPVNAPVIVPIVRGRGQAVGAAIPLTDADPVGGVVLSTLVTAIARPAAAAGTSIGLITGLSMHKVMAAIEELFSY